MQEAMKSMKEKGIKAEDVKNLPPIEEIHGLNLPPVEETYDLNPSPYLVKHRRALLACDNPCSFSKGSFNQRKKLCCDSIIHLLF